MHANLSPRVNTFRPHCAQQPDANTLPPNLEGDTMRALNSIALAILAVPVALAAQDESQTSQEAGRVGSVEFPSSGAERARPAFLLGIALLHSFEYGDAADAFREAQRLDAAFAMAYWGEALTYRHPLWGQEDLARARAVLARFAPTAPERLSRAGSARERVYGAAIEALFAEADEPVRARAFADSMRSVLRQHPSDLEAAAFTALALLASNRFLPAADRPSIVAEAGALAERIFAARPLHPGAAHYLIHAYDSPALAPRGLAAARAYAQIAPDAQHALHMPSHIFVQVGLWDDVAASNARSWAASRAWVVRRRASATEHDFHSLQWLQYGYLQQGRWALARSIIDTARVALADAVYDGGFVDARHAVGNLAFQWMSETGQWDPELAALVRAEGIDTASARGHQFLATTEFQRALVAAGVRGDTVPAASLVERLARVESRPVVQVRRELLRAALARARGDSAGELAALERATAAEAGIPAYGPPGYRPASEQLAVRLRESGRASDAATRYAHVLTRYPNRSSALLGLIATGDSVVASRSRLALRTNYQRADGAVAARVPR
jgi:hypothetical protein